VRRFGYGLGLLVVTFAASYVLIYLYRWEWNRALISAALLLVAEVALVGVAAIDRLRRIEAKVESISRESHPAHQAPAGKSSAIIRQAAIGESTTRAIPPAASVGDSSPVALPAGDTPAILFPWLRDPDEPADRFGVFVPILMGAGILLSGAAWLVERFARAVNRTGLRGRPADRLGYLTLPPGGPFVTGELRLDDPRGDVRLVDRRLSVRRRIAVAVGALTIVGPGVFFLADLTQSRPDPDMPADASIVTIDVSSTTSGVGAVAVRAARQWELCRDTSNLDLQTSTLLQVQPSKFVGVVTPALGEQAERRFRGCLADLRIDFVQLRVVSIEDVNRQQASARGPHSGTTRMMGPKRSLV
jgi:hypothetical protein